MLKIRFNFVMINTYAVRWSVFDLCYEIMYMFYSALCIVFVVWFVGQMMMSAREQALKLLCKYNTFNILQQLSYIY